MAASRINGWFPTTTRWSADDARVALDAWKRSGLGAQTFAREHGISAQRLYWWRDRLAARPPAMSLVPGEIVEAAVDGEQTSLVIRVGEATIEIADASASWVARLVRELAS